MSTILRTRSPYFIRTADESDADLSYFQLNITINTGVLGVAQCPTNLGTIALKKRILPNETSVTFELSELFNDYIEQTFNGNYSTSANTQSLWASTNITARKADGTTIGSAVLADYLIQEGYNLFKDGVNYVTEPEAMLTANHIQIARTDTLNIPVNAERVNSVVFKAGQVTIGTTNITDTGDADQKIQYISSANTGVDSVVITYDTTSTRTITVDRLTECKYSPFKCVFLNRWGALQDLYFFKKSTESLESSKESFNKSIFAANTVSYGFPIGSQTCTASSTYNTYSTTAHASSTFNTNAKETLELNTGFVKESMNESFKELLVSEYIWLVDSSDNILPVTLKDSAFTTKTGLNDKMINYTMQFEKSFDLINNIR